MTLDPTTLIRPTVVEVWAPTCAVCKQMQPDLDAMLEEFGGRVDLVVVDVSTDLDAARALSARGTPTIIGFADGEERFRHAGRMTRSELEGLFASLAEGTEAPRAGATDLALRLGAGGALVAIGLATGPQWVLAAVGAVIAAIGAWSWWRTSR